MAGAFLSLNIPKPGLAGWPVAASSNPQLLREFKRVVIAQWEWKLSRASTQTEAEVCRLAGGEAASPRREGDRRHLPVGWDFQPGGLPRRGGACSGGDARRPRLALGKLPVPPSRMAGDGGALPQVHRGTSPFIRYTLAAVSWNMAARSLAE